MTEGHEQVHGFTVTELFVQCKVPVGPNELHSARRVTELPQILYNS